MRSTNLTIECVILRIKELNKCWIWEGSLDPQGYAIYSRDTRVARWMWEQKHGKKMQNGYLAAHTCDVKSCVNPDHIYEATQMQNVHDAMRAGTHRGRLPVRWKKKLRLRREQGEIA